MDVFKNSIFIDDKIKEKVTSDLLNYFKRVNAFIDSLDIRTNIYFSGSLARKEPSIKWSGAEYRLESDIDYIFLVESNRDKKKYFDLDITRKMNELFPEYKNSVVVLTIEEVQNIKSVIGYNLVAGGENCIRENMGGVNFPKVSVNESDILDSVINIIAILVTFPKNFRRSQIFKSGRDYYESKLLAEGMKLPHNSKTYREALNQFYLNSSREEMMEYLLIIKSRELNSELRFEPRNIITRFLLLRFDYPTIEDLLMDKYRESDSFINYCQVLFLSLYLEIEIDELIFREIQDVLQVDAKNYEQMLELRVRYMLEIHKQNTGTTLESLPDLKHSFTE